MRTSPWRLATYALIVLVGVLIALPNILTPGQLAALPDWLPKKQVTLGLDLRGGSHLVLEVDAGALKAARLKTFVEDARKKADEEGLALKSVRVDGDTASFVPGDPADLDRMTTVLKGINAWAGGSSFGPGVYEFDVAAAEGAVTAALTQAGVHARVSAAVDQSLEIVRRRVDQVGVAEPTVQRVGADRILVQLPGLQDPTRLKALLGSTAQMSFHLVAPDYGMRGRVPAGVTMMPSADGKVRYPVENRTLLSGDRLTDAQAGFDQRSGQPIVSFRFDSLGTRQFADITRNNLGRAFAVVLDGKVLTAPVIREAITGGSGQISGDFTVAETSVLSALLRAGALPAPLTVIEQRSVGPDLGGDAIRMGLLTGLAGFALVVAFMVILYRGWGMIANLALCLNVILTVGALGLIGATLTLPGIAGVILGIGMAVDANILINERIREELKRGASVLQALDVGFRRAYSTIVDSNVTTLIATLLLFMFGSGPVRGFAITMMLGIGISMFTAVSVVRVLMTEIVRRRRLKTLEFKPLFKLVPDNPEISFMKARFFGIGLSAILSLTSIALFFAPGLRYGIDFKGGIQMEVEAPQSPDLAALREGLTGLGLGEIALQNIGGKDSVLIRAERQPGGEEAQNGAVEKLRAAIGEIIPGASVESTEVVGPKVSGELASSGFIAVSLAMAAMLGYIWWRFEWHFAVGAIATLILDTTKTVGFFALTGLDFNLTAIAALLTIIGYSVNDKVVVYDRMRENLRLYKSMPLRQIIDKSINESLARCIFTSTTTFLSMLPMAVSGGAAVTSFAIPMVFGILIATSSSIFIAAPILLFLGDWKARRKKEPSKGR
ncbi:protein translocase subunit SecD [Radicibacter daui]|uniref:protein translocase subunit SecD n=1 Tax=Radicibacter daui TaxID=3064829 RepID=UPI004046E4E1